MNNYEKWVTTIKQNDKLIKTLRHFPNLDKTKIAERIGVSTPTLYKILSDLKEEKILEGDKLINRRFGAFVGISIGASFCKVLLLNFDFSVFTKEELQSIKDDYYQIYEDARNAESNYLFFKTPGTFFELKERLNTIFEILIKHIESGNIRILGIGISSTGTIDEKNQIIYQSHNLSFLDGRTIDDFCYSNKKTFFESKNIKMFLVQNSIAAVIAEKTDLINQEYDFESSKNIVALYLDYGISTGFIINNSLYSGSNGFSGEIGHTPLPTPILTELNDEIITTEYKYQQKCACGAIGCIDIALRDLGGLEKYKDSNSDAIKQYLETNKMATKSIGTILGYITNTLSAILNIDLIIYTGKLYKSIEVLNKDIESTLDKNSLIYNRRACKIHKSRIGTLAPAIGAALYSYYKSCGIEIEWN